MAPSPTGNLHLGTAYTTLFNYLFAKRMQGAFILRIEDTDRERSKLEFEENILDGLKWLNLNWDEGPYRQSERLENYQKAALKLVAEGKAYRCFCSKEDLDKEREDRQKLNLSLVYSGKCRNLSDEEIKTNLEMSKPAAIRFKMPEDRGEISFEDLIHGKISFDSKLLGDMVILRSNQTPLYNFSVVVDDVDMQITHVLRGDDHLSNTPKQIVLFEALNAKVPEFAHWPSILNPDRIGKLSKRNNATSIDDYKKLGFLSEAIVNYLALLGWTFPEDKEIMSLKDMEENFDLKKMRLSPAAFNMEKFEWMNGEYIRNLLDEELLKRLQEFLVDHPDKDKIEKVVPLIKDRIKKLSEFIPLTDFLFNTPEYDIKVFEKLNIKNPKEVLGKVLEKLTNMEKPWKANIFEQTFRDLAKEEGLQAAQFFQLLRAAVSGQLITPPLFESIQILGEDETEKRIKKAIDIFTN